MWTSDREKSEISRGFPARAPRVLAVAASLLCVCVVPALAEHGAAQDAGLATRPGTIVVVVDRLRSDLGVLVGGLYDREAGWLHPDVAQDCHAPIVHGRALCTFHTTARLTVAFAALHDEDGDGELDRDLIGLPQEGYAFSNEAREPFGPPSFEAASFLQAQTRPFLVHARYGI